MLTKTGGKGVALFAIFLSFSINAAAQTSAKSPATALPNAPEPLALTAVVTDKKGDLISGLRRENFQLFIDKRPADIIDFRENDDPLSVGIIFDVSGSVGGAQSVRTFLRNSQRALKTFLDASNRSNQYFLMAFNIKSQLLMDWTSDTKALVDGLSVLQPKGNTALYDACYLAIDKVQHGRNSKHVLIFITDGQDNVSSYSLDQVRAALKASDVLVYSVNFSGTGIEGSDLGMEGQKILNELSLLSGGMSFYRRLGKALTGSDATSIFQLIGNELQHQYTIVITPNISSDTGKWHKIEIKLKATASDPDEMKHFTVRTREGFYVNHL